MKPFQIINFMETKFTNFWTWLKSFPTWLRAVVLTLLAILALIASMSLSACGVTRATVKNGASDTTTEIKITTNNPTSVTTTPTTDLIVSPNK